MELNKQQPFIELQKVLTLFDQTSTEAKISWLEKCSQQKLNSVKLINAYHDQLLFLSAYAENKQIFRLTQDELNRLSDALIQLSAQKKEQLSNSGMPFTEIQGTYSFVLMQWLIKNFPNSVSIHSFDETGVHPKELLKYRLNEMEFECIGNDTLSKTKWIQLVSGFKKPKDQLKWLLKEFEMLNIDTVFKEQLFESLKLYIRINPADIRFSRSYGTVPIKEHYFHTKGLLKKFDEQALINQKLPAPLKLSNEEKQVYLDKARVALLLLNRETDPITYGEAKDCLVYNLEHGLTIALYCIQPALRLSVESYIGFMMFKNGYPMSYGGAWLFGQRSLIGINIFEAFRGGESAFVFAQLLRTYSQAFGATQFEVEPYQFGKGNPEGIKSGAFWFYYRFGFRPIDTKLAQLAEQEASKIAANKGYRTDYETLKLFTKSNLLVNFKPTEIDIKPLQISYFITAVIASQFMGSRVEAQKYCKATLQKELGINFLKLKNEERIGFAKLSHFCVFCLNLQKLKPNHRLQLKTLILKKGTSEYQYIREYYKFPFDLYFTQALLDFKVK